MFDFIIIGGGIIGLNLARVLKERSPAAGILLIEKEEDVARHGSGRNSGVLPRRFLLHGQFTESQIHPGWQRPPSGVLPVNRDCASIRAARWSLRRMTRRCRGWKS